MRRLRLERKATLLAPEGACAGPPLLLLEPDGAGAGSMGPALEDDDAHAVEGSWMRNLFISVDASRQFVAASLAAAQAQLGSTPG